MNTPPAPGPAEVEVLADLVREVDTLRRRLGDLDQVGDRLDELDRVVAQLANTLATVAARRRVPAAPSWLLASTGADEVAVLLDELCAWLAAVFLRYPDGATALPECWLWHPDVVEELLWLMHAWCAAYQGENASVQAAGDWHDRQRPGVLARLRKSVGSCSVERHQTRPGWSDVPTPAAAVPGLAHTALIVGWWSAQRDGTPPEPPAVAPNPIGGALR
ncbi:hypothetical protein ND486_25610 [Pseudonocardia sp. DR1-2]|uniref:hypothetical protein n=1 Tax=Pseudonocardia sp. DR1-2 TaxID=2951168 RepID=UPI002044C204|nr:hypothetical protein [Pseudonocardia sp. DR1-2]MCM3849577.1 hypothetical protein [Pseudonocardia sp. DR1-2]